MKINIQRSQFINFLSKGFASILEQGLFSGISFITSLLLGRWFLAEEYGAYSVAMSIFLLLAGLYSSLILEPLSIFGAQTSEDQRDKYYGSVLIFHIILSIVLLAGSVIFSFFWKIQGVSVLRVMSLNIPFVLTYWLIRWKFYNESNPKKILFITITYVTLLSLLLILFKKLSIITPEIIFIYTGVTSIFISVVFLFRTPLSFQLDAIRRDFFRHWNYGKWILVASLLQWVSMQIYLVFVATKLSFSDGGGYRAIQNFATPIDQVSTAIGLLLIPWVARRYQKNKKSLNLIHWINVILGVIGGLYLLVIWLVKDSLVNFIYQGKYNEYTWLLPYLIGVPILFSLSKGSQIGTRIIQRPYLLLISYGVSSIFTLFIGSILIDRYGIFGAAIGRLFATFLFSVVINILYFLVNISLNKNNNILGSLNEEL